jgi:hypothetical protein
LLNLWFDGVQVIKHRAAGIQQRPGDGCRLKHHGNAVIK